MTCDQIIIKSAESSTVSNTYTDKNVYHREYSFLDSSHKANMYVGIESLFVVDDTCNS